MANIKSQKKRVLTNEKAHLRNVAVKTGLKTAIRATREAIAAGDKAAAEAAYKVAAQKLDKAAGAGVTRTRPPTASPASLLRSTLCEHKPLEVLEGPASHVICGTFCISVQRGTLAFLRNDISVQRGTEYGKPKYKHRHCNTYTQRFVL